MAISFEDIGNRLRAFRLASGMSGEEIAGRLGISRSALYRIERGEVAKIETLERLSELLDVSVATLLGVGVEYIPSAVAFFERIRQIEETADHIISMAGPVSYLLSSDDYDETLAEALRESAGDGIEDGRAAAARVDELIAILRRRKATYHERRPGVLNLISAEEMESFLAAGLAGRGDLPGPVLKKRRERARAEAEHRMRLMEHEPIGVQIGIVPLRLPFTSFQIFRQPGRKFLAVSPFRLGRQPNVQIGVGMITDAPEAVAQHEKIARDVWDRALKGRDAARFLKQMIARYTE